MLDEDDEATPAHVVYQESHVTWLFENRIGVGPWHQLHRFGELSIPTKYVCMRITKIAVSDRATQGQQIVSDCILLRRS